MEKFNHYGVEVIYQVIDGPFEEVLKQNGVKYTALPYIEDIVFRYEKDGQRRYAYIEVEKLPDDYAERVYITSEIPEDLSWKGIAEDYRNQKSGERPANLHTRAYMIFSAAYNDALRNMPFTFDLNAAPGKRDVAYALIKYYVSIDDLKEMDHHDCPMIDEF